MDMLRLLLLGCLCACAVPATAQDTPPVLRRKPTPTPPPEGKKPPAETKDSKPKPETKPAPEPEEQAEPTTQRPVEAKPDPRDPGAPKLRRGVPARRPAVPDGPEPNPVPLPETPIRVVVTDAEGRVVSAPPAEAGANPADDLVERAREIAYEFNAKLPNFLCDQLTMRSSSETRIPKWKHEDRVEVELMYVDGSEDYRNVRINGKRLKKGAPEDSGTWSRGEFGTILVDIFSDSTNARFRLRGESNAAGLAAKVYDFTVQQPNSHWRIIYGRSVYPAYKGSLWIDPKTARVLRIEMSTKQLPPDYAIDTVETAIDYGWVTISGERHLLPLNSQVLSCYRGSFDCTMNELTFKNYRKFAAESQVLTVDSEISFPGAEPAKPPAPTKSKKK
jgi:hypothetical protein